MKLRKLFTLIAFAHIGISLSAISNLAVAESAKEIAQEEVDVKKENEKKRKNALLIQKVIGEGGVLTAIGRTKKKEDYA
mgnify:CR=1 FL=1